MAADANKTSGEPKKEKLNSLNVTRLRPNLNILTSATQSITIALLFPRPGPRFGLGLSRAITIAAVIRGAPGPRK